MTTSSSNEDFPVFHLDESSPEWRIVSRNSLYDGPYIGIEEVRYHSPGHPDQPVTWTVARRKNAVIIAPRLDDGRFLLIRQERYPIQRTLWEFPAGQIDDTSDKENREVILATALRELTEETGHSLDPVTGKLLSLGYFFSSQGFTDEHAYLFLATGLTDAAPVTLGEGNERIHEVKPFSAQEISSLIAQNEIVDANTLSLWARLVAKDLL